MMYVMLLITLTDLNGDIGRDKRGSERRDIVTVNDITLLPRKGEERRGE
jgi:hypothetical protein